MPFYLAFRFLKPNSELLKPFSVTLGLSMFNLVHSKEQDPFKLLGIGIVWTSVFSLYGSPLLTEFDLLL